MKSFIKYPGGKSWLASILADRIRAECKDGWYMEPFLGGGSMFFSIEPDKAMLSDVNPHIINLFRCVKYHPFDVHEQAKILLSGYNKMDEGGREQMYYDVRTLYNEAQVKPLDVGMGFSLIRASQFLFLLKTCFNGLVRFNNSGKFNTPHGKYKSPSVDKMALIDTSSALDGAVLVYKDFGEIARHTTVGDVVYFDPPYEGTFNAYSSGKFSREDQSRLRDVAGLVVYNGARVYASLPDTPNMRRMWLSGGLFNAYSIPVKRSIAAKSSSRGDAMELLVFSHHQELPEMSEYEKVRI